MNKQNNYNYSNKKKKRPILPHWLLRRTKTILYTFSVRDIIKQWWRMKPNRKTNYVSLMETFSCKYASKQGDRQRLQSPYQMLLIKCSRGCEMQQNAMQIFILIWARGTHSLVQYSKFGHILLMTCVWCARYWCLNCVGKKSNSSTHSHKQTKKKTEQNKKETKFSMAIDP